MNKLVIELAKDYTLNKSSFKAKMDQMDLETAKMIISDLLDMNLRSLTLKKLNDLKQQLNNIIDKLDALNLKSPHQLYIDDIHDFEKVYNKEYIK